MTDNGLCRLCGSDQTAPRFPRTALPLYYCDVCEAVHRPGEIGREDLEKIYTEDYFLKTWPGSLGRFFHDFEPDKRHKPRFFGRQLGFLESLVGGKGRLLDVGCANGLFVWLARERGWKAEGVELSSFAAEWGVKQFGVTIHQGEIFDLPIEPAYDVITLWDTIEHLPDPARTIAACYERLSPQGVLAVLTPDTGSLINHLVHASQAMVPLKSAPLVKKLYHEDHLTYFNRHSLTRALLTAGFNIHWIEGYDEDPRDTETRGLLRAAVTLVHAAAWVIQREHEILVLARKGAQDRPVTPD